MEAISPALRTATKVLNASYLDTLRKRKSDICHTLGKSFGGFVHSLSGEKQLFDDNTIKKNETIYTHGRRENAKGKKREGLSKD